MPTRKLPSDEVIRRWREDEGLSLKEIHERLALGRMGVTRRIRYDDWLPWPLIVTEHNQAWEATMLRTGARLARGLEVSAKNERLFHEWMADLADRDLVVAYRPDRGFFYTKPRPGLDGRDGIPVRLPPREAGEKPIVFS